MTRSHQVRLRQQLAVSYYNFFQNLIRYLGSLKRASEALQEAVLCIDRMSVAELVHSLADYAINIVKNKKARNYRVSAAEIDVLIVDLCDDATDSARIVKARWEVETLERVLAKVPRRVGRVIFLMALEGKTVRETAAVLGLSVHAVAADLQAVLKYCAASLD